MPLVNKVVEESRPGVPNLQEELCPFGGQENREFDSKLEASIKALSHEVSQQVSRFINCLGDLIREEFGRTRQALERLVNYLNHPGVQGSRYFPLYNQHQRRHYHQCFLRMCRSRGCCMPEMATGEIIIIFSRRIDHSFPR